MIAAVLHLGADQLALATLLILLNAAASLALRLGLGKDLLTAAVRPVVQLALLALILEWVFSVRSPFTVLALMVFMGLYAGFEAVRRTTRRIQGIYAISMGFTLLSGMLVTLYGLTMVVRVEPWYEPQYAIPIMGMMLGNTLNGITLGLQTSLDGYLADREKIEMLLAHGATRKEARHDVVCRAVRTGTIPILNMMAVSGIVSIPGMMTGQILAGSPPGEAAAYQVFILFSIAGSVALGTVGVTLASARLVFDERDRLRVDRIRKTK